LPEKAGVDMETKEGKEAKEAKETEGLATDNSQTATDKAGGEIGLLPMFFLFVKIGLVTIGGGYVMIPMLQKEFVTKRSLMDFKEFCNIMAIAQAGPGGIAINSSTVVGYKLRGFVGAVVATIGTVVPSFLVIVLLAAWLLQPGNADKLTGFMFGAAPAVVGVLIAAAWSLGKEVIEDKMGAVLAIAGFVAVVVLDVHPVLVILVAGLAGFFYYRTRIEPETGASCDLPSRLNVKTARYDR
jgi:chromate transporter